MVIARTLAGFALLSVALVHAQSAPPSVPELPAPDAAGPADPSMDEILNRSAKSHDDPESVAGKGWQEHAEQLVKEQTAQHGEEIKAIADGGQSIMKQAIDKAAKDYGLPTLGATDKAKQPAPRYRLYVSQSMGDEGLKQAMLVAIQQKDLVISMRGMKPGQTLRQMYEYLGKILRVVSPPGEPMPLMEVNPPVFSNAKATDAPTLEKIDDEGHRLAWVRGVIEPSWIDGQVASKNTGDLGARGTTYPVVEEDMLEKIQNAAKNFDFTAWGQRAQSQFWAGKKFMELPKATIARERTIDPTVEVKKDIVTPDGQVIAHQGERYNPMEGVGFHQTLLIFNATDQDQVDFAVAYAKAHAESKVTMIATEMDREKGWDGFADVQNKIGRAVYLMNQLIEDTFHIEHVPSLVTARDLAFVVTEVPVHHAEVGNAADNTQTR